MFWVGVTLFFIVGPSLILYADGYRINVTDRELLETGTLVVSTTPVTAKITLDGKTYDSKTPLTIGSLEPKEYTLTLESEGYLPWTKHLLISAGQSTFASDIRLIKDATVVREKGNVQHLFYDRNTRRGFITTQTSENGITTAFYASQLFSNLLQSYREVLVPVTNSNSTSIVAWAPTENRVILRTDNRYWLVNFNYGANVAQEITSIIPSGWKSIRWSTRNADELITTTPDGVSLINLAAVTRRDIQLNTDAQPQIFTDAFSFENSIYVIASTDSASQILRTDSSGNASYVYTLPGNRATYIGHNNDILVIKTGENQLQVHHKTEEDYRLGFTFDQVKDVIFDPINNSLLFTNGNELFTYAIEHDSLALLVRQGSAITNIDWFDESHATYISDNSVYLIERDGRDGHINWILSTTRQFDNYFIPDSYDTLYFVGDTSEGIGLYKRDI